MNRRDIERLKNLSVEGSPPPWRTGTKVGRTVYRGDGPDDLIGVFDSKIDAELAVALRNACPAILVYVERLEARNAMLEAMAKAAMALGRLQAQEHGMQPNEVAHDAYDAMLKAREPKEGA